MRRLLAAALAALAIPAGASALAPSPASAARPPVVMIVFDEFPVGDLMLPDGRLDTKRFPGFAALARGSTWFPNATTVHDSTHEAVPAILTGQEPGIGLGTGWRSHPDSIFEIAHRLHYRMHVREEATTICRPSLCRRTAHYGNPEFNIRYQRRERLDATIRNLQRSSRPTFTFHHSIVPHVPWVYLPSGQNRTGYPPGTFPNLAVANGFKDQFLTQFNEQAHLLQVGYVDRQVGRLVKQLKRTGQWKRALVVVTADHGISFQTDFSRDIVDRRRVSPENIQDIAPVPLFVKAPGQTRGRIDRALASTVDIVPTMARLLHTSVGYPMDGHDAFGPVVAARRDVSINRRFLNGSLVISGQELNRLRAVTAGYRAALFGTGPWSRVYRIGPNQKLLGLPVSSLPRTAPGTARVRFRVPSGLRDVNPSAPAVPAMAGGEFTQGAQSAPRDLALAVNGRIAAVGRSVHLEFDRHEYFALNVPVSALQKGRNTMQLFEVIPAGLVPLGSAP